MSRRGLLLCSTALALALPGCGGGTTPTAPPASVPAAAEGFLPTTGARLHYALDLPAGPGPFPAVVMGHGSGQSTKQEGAAFVALWRPMGFAVLRYDKRGVGQSTGTYRGLSGTNSTTQVDELADDMLAGVAFLKTRTDIAGARIGLMGVSQAGWIMAAAAGRSADVRFFVAVVGSAVPVGTNVYYEGLRTLPIDEAYARMTLFDGPPGWDPLSSLRAATVPGIWLLAAEDRLVPTRLCAPELAGLRAEGHRYTVRIYPGVGHELEGSSVFWSDVTSWLASEGLR